MKSDLGAWSRRSRGRVLRLSLGKVKNETDTTTLGRGGRIVLKTGFEKELHHVGDVGFLEVDFWQNNGLQFATGLALLRGGATAEDAGDEYDCECLHCIIVQSGNQASSGATAAGDSSALWCCAFLLLRISNTQTLSRITRV